MGTGMSSLASLRKAGLTNEAIGAALADESGRKAPSRARVQDWISGLRAAPKWTKQAAAAHLCRLWEMERRTVPADALARCDAQWAALVNPILGQLYLVLSTVPLEIQVHMRTLTVCIRNEVSQRLNIELPGV